MRRYTVVILAVALAAGCSSNTSEGVRSRTPSEFWQNVPDTDFHVFDCHSSDGRLIVTVAIPVTERGLSVGSASQLRVRDTVSNAEKVYTWAHDGSGGANFPIITDIFRMEEGRYLLLGKMVSGVLDVRLYGWVVRTGEDHLTVLEAVSLYGRNARMVILNGGRRLGLFVLDAPSNRFSCGIKVHGRSLSDKEIAAALQPAPKHVGYWYTRSNLMNQEPPDGRVMWVDLDTKL